MELTPIEQQEPVPDGAGVARVVVTKITPRPRRGAGDATEHHPNR